MGSVQSTSSVVASRARTSARRGKAKASKASGRGSGGKCTGSSRKRDPVGSLLRTYLLSELEALTQFSPTWIEQATPLGRSWWVLGASVPITRGTVPGLLPTPVVTDGMSNFGWKLRARATWESGPRTLAQTLNALIFGLRGREPCTVPARPHPEYVEWMMGFPTSWTALGVSETRSIQPSLN